MNDIQIKIASFNNQKNISIGSIVSYSPVGPGVFTDITDAGYPRVNRIAVTWMITETGVIYGEPNRLNINDRKAAEELNLKAFYYYSININGKDEEFLESTGPNKDAVFPKVYSLDMNWIIKFEQEVFETNVNTDLFEKIVTDNQVQINYNTTYFYKIAPTSIYNPTDTKEIFKQGEGPYPEAIYNESFPVKLVWFNHSS